VSKLPNFFDFGLISAYKTPKKYFLYAASSLGVTLQNDYDFFV